MSIDRRVLPSLFVAVVFGACGDDTSSSSNEDAGPHDHERSDAAAEGGAGGQGGQSGKGGKGSEKDAGQPAAADASTRGDSGKTMSDTEQAITLRFRAQVGDEPFACGSSYAEQGNSKVRVTPRDLRLFVQDVALVDDNGKEVPVRLDTREPWQTPEIALLDFEDASGECLADAETNHEITGVVPKGNYRAVRFSNGVPEKLNHSDPKTFPAPMKTPNMSWNWLLGLRFIRFEMATEASAELDTDAGADPGSYSLHIGSTACAGNQNAGTIKCGKPNRSRIELSNYDVADSEIIFDVAPLLTGNDLSKTVECHAGTPNCEPMFQAMGVSYATGEPLDAQSVFRLK